MKIMRRVFERPVKALRRLASEIRRLVLVVDMQDVHIYGGLAIAGVGGLYISARWTMVALGVVLVLMGMFAPGVRSE